VGTVLLPVSPRENYTRCDKQKTHNHEKITYYPQAISLSKPFFILLPFVIMSFISVRNRGKSEFPTALPPDGSKNGIGDLLLIWNYCEKFTGNIYL
jgi:hypothetical protein